jgi:type VII secretion protein EccE
VVLVLAAAGRSLAVLASAAVAAGTILAVGWLRVGHRWLYQWLGIGIRYAGRRHGLTAGAPATRLLALIAPGTRVVPAEFGADAAAVLVDHHGLAAVLELGDPDAVVGDADHPLPSPASLLPPATSDTPPVQVQLVLEAVPAPSPRVGGGVAVTSYRRLAGGRLAAQGRALLAVRVLRADGWAEDDLRRALSSSVRKVRGRLGDVPSSPLGPAAALRVLAELAHHDGAYGARETWSAVHVGGLHEVTFRLRRWPDPHAQSARRLVPRLLALPATAVTVAMTVGPRDPDRAGAVAADLAIRVTAEDPAGLAVGVPALHALLAAERAGVERLDGEQLDGLAATLPLGGPAPPTLTRAARGGRAEPTGLDLLELSVGNAGLMIGTNRHGAPVVARLFRPEPTRALLAGRLAAAQLLAMRALALGANLAIETARPHAWEPFLRAVAGPGQTIPVTPPGRHAPAPPASPFAPLLVIVDAGAVPTEDRPGSGWQASLVVRDGLGPGEVDALSHADLAVLQHLRPGEAASAGAALGLGENAGWLSRMRRDMVAVVHRRSVRWALLSATDVETQLIGPVERG